MSNDRREHKQLLQRLPHSIRRKIVSGQHLDRTEEEQVLEQLTSVKELTVQLTRELGLEHDMEHMTSEHSPTKREQ